MGLPGRLVPELNSFHGGHVLRPVVFQLISSTFVTSHANALSSFLYNKPVTVIPFNVQRIRRVKNKFSTMHNLNPLCRRKRLKNQRNIFLKSRSCFSQECCIRADAAFL